MSDKYGIERSRERGIKLGEIGSHRAAKTIMSGFGNSISIRANPSTFIFIITPIS